MFFKKKKKKEKSRLQHRCFPVDIAKCLITAVYVTLLAIVSVFFDLLLLHDHQNLKQTSGKKLPLKHLFVNLAHTLEVV